MIARRAQSEIEPIIATGIAISKGQGVAITNTAYWHAIHEVMAEVPDVCRPPYRAVVEYRRPIQYGEDVTLRWARRGDDVNIAIAVGEEVRAAALLRKLD